MCLRWTAAGMLEAEQQFRKIIGYTRPRQARHPRRARPHRPTRHDTHHDPRGGRYARHRLTITPGPPSRSSTTDGNSDRYLHQRSGPTTASFATQTADAKRRRSREQLRHQPASPLLQSAVHRFRPVPTERWARWEAYVGDQIPSTPRPAQLGSVSRVDSGERAERLPLRVTASVRPGIAEAFAKDD